LKNDEKTLYQNLKKAILEIYKKDRETLQIFGLVNIAEQDYMEYPLPTAS
jgi:alpha-ketoglutarate-dependent taurine dioxygenase